MKASLDWRLSHGLVFVSIKLAAVKNKWIDHKTSTVMESYAELSKIAEVLGSKIDVWL